MSPQVAEIFPFEAADLSLAPRARVCLFPELFLSEPPIESFQWCYMQGMLIAGTAVDWRSIKLVSWASQRVMLAD